MRIIHLTAGSLVLAVGVLGGGAGCAHQVGSAGLTSASTTADVGPTDPAALRLADEICGRAVSCKEVGDGAHYRSEEACQSDQGVRAPAQTARWTCTPTQASLDRCLAAIRGQACETILTNVDQLPQCREDAVCGRHP